MKTCYLWVSDHHRQRIVYRLQWKVVWRQELLQVCSVLQYFLRHRKLNTWTTTFPVFERNYPYRMGPIFLAALVWKHSNKRCHYKPTSIEVLPPGNKSPSFKGFFPYIKGPIYRATPWPNQWSHRVLLGIKWKIWTFFFHWYTPVHCGLSGLDTTTCQSQEYFKKLKMLKISQFSSAAGLKFLDTFFCNRLPFLDKWHNDISPKPDEAQGYSKSLQLYSRALLWKVANSLNTPAVSLKIGAPSCRRGKLISVSV